MEHIRKAIERAKASSSPVSLPPEIIAPPLQQPQVQPNAIGASALGVKEVVLRAAHLESKRIISYDVADPRSKSFDMLRTQVLQTMAMKSWQSVGVTSPTAGCGKSTIAVNLALSIARQPSKSVLLIDMDIQKPQVAKSFGVQCKRGLLSTLEGQTDLRSAMFQACIGDEKILVLPCETSKLNSSALMASQSMAAIFQQIKRDFRGWTVIIDLPPILMSDDVITILPQIDCGIFVATVGTSTVAEIKECTRHLEAVPIVRVVLNKSSDPATTYYSRYGHYLATETKA